MAWEWYDNILGLDGKPMECNGSNTSWDYCFANLNGSYHYIGYDVGDFLSGGSGIYAYTYPDTKTVTTDYGFYIYSGNDGSRGYDLTIKMVNEQYTLGGLGALGTKATIRFAVNRSSQRATVVLIRSFQNGPWYTEAYECIQQSDEASSELYDILINHPIPTPYTSNGGGATHIAKVTGQLKDLSSNLSDILIVSGGGGGGMLIDDDVYVGADAGGISGSGDNSADQTTGNAFGLGESGSDVSGGGGGLYGGYKGAT